MTSRSRSCKNHPDSFGYNCGKFKITIERNCVTDFLRKAYHAYFDIQLGDQDKLRSPPVVCKTCVKHLRQWTQGSQKALKFGIPMIWREPKKPYQRLLFLCYQFDRN